MNTTKYVGFADACRITGYTRRSLYRFIDRGQITRYRIGGRVLLDVDELRTLLRAPLPPEYTASLQTA